MEVIDRLKFDEVYVVSDLHLGGPPGSQIFDQGPQFEKFLASLSASGAAAAKTKSAAQKSVCLVINGDLVDFLADQNAKAFDAEGAVEKLDRICNEDAFKPVWRGLRAFVKTPNRTLAITLGNHDIELALPWVRERLIEQLCDGDDAARGRIALVFDGTGFRCQVGAVRVLCVHGNEVDSWNLTDYEQLRRIGRDLMLSRPDQKFDEWVPNAGSGLVVKVMNQIKHQYPFVDLLKPENDAVLPILATLDAARDADIRQLASIASRKTWDQVRHAFGFLGEAAGEREAPPPPRSATARSFQPVDAAGALALAEKRMQDNEDPFNLISGEALSQKLGLRDWVNGALSWIQGKPKQESLRKVLASLRDDWSFEPATKDDTFRRLDELAGAQIDIIVAGHTHLERALEREKSRGFYYNSGTWVKLMRLTEPELGSETGFQRFYDAVESGKSEKLAPYVFRNCTVVRIRSGSSAELCHFEDGKLKPVPGTQFGMGR